MKKDAFEALDTTHQPNAVYEAIPLFQGGFTATPVDRNSLSVILDDLPKQFDNCAVRFESPVSTNRTCDAFSPQRTIGLAGAQFQIVQTQQNSC